MLVATAKTSQKRKLDETDAEPGTAVGEGDGEDRGHEEEGGARNDRCTKPCRHERRRRSGAAQPDESDRYCCQVETKCGRVQGPQDLDDARGLGQGLGLGGEHDLDDVHDREKRGDGRRAEDPHGRPPPILIAAGARPYPSDEGEEGEHLDREHAQRDNGSGPMVQEIGAIAPGAAPRIWRLGAKDVLGTTRVFYKDKTADAGIVDQR